MAKSQIDTFIDNLIDRRGYDEAPQEIKEQLHEDLKRKLDEYVMTKTIAEFSPAEVAEFEKLLDEDKPAEDLKKFAVQHIPDYQTFMTSTLVAFQEAYLS
jgi:hypothetical protein